MEPVQELLWVPAGIADQAHSPLGPQAPGIRVHRVLDHCLNHAVDGERLRLRVSREQRCRAQGRHHAIEGIAVCYTLLQVRAKVRPSNLHGAQWNAIGVEKGTQTQQVSGGRM